MPGPFISLHRIAVLSFVFVFLCVFIFSSTSLREGTRVVERIKESAKETANNLCNGNQPVFGKPKSSDLFLKFFETILYPITERTYTNPAGRVFGVKEDAPWWKEPLKNEVLILDIDTRVPQGKNELWNTGRLDWENMNAESDGGMVSASFMNHFLYSKIHGYDYRFFNAHEMEGMHATWVKPHALFDLLQEYRFVIFLDADATIQHLELPVEWLFNRWGITPQTSIAMPLDTRQILDGDEHASEDSKGKLVLNSGVIVAQALPFYL